MQRYFDVVQNRQGTAVVGATVTVYDANGNLATLYSNNSNAASSNPVYTNSDGEYAFYAANGTYSLQITATNYATETKPGVVLFDPSDSSASNNVQFLQAGTGAQVRSVQSKLRDVVSVKDFGAAGDGVADDTAAIQAAITYVLTLVRGGQVRFPSGTYKIGSQINIPKTPGKSVTLMGLNGSALTNALGFTDHMFYVGGALAAGGSGVIFQSINFVSNATLRCVKLQNANLTRFVNCKFTNIYLGVEMTSSYAVTFERCVFDISATYCIYSSTSAHHTLIFNCNFYNTGTTNAYTIEFAGATDNLIVRDSVAEVGWAFLGIAGGTAFTFEGNYVEYFTNTPFFFSAELKGASIRNNWIALSGTLTLSNISGGEYENNSSYNQTVSVNLAAVIDLVWGGNSLIGTGSLPYAKRTFTNAPSIATITNAASDAAAAAVGVPVGGMYRDGSVLKIRVT